MVTRKNNSAFATTTKLNGLNPSSLIHEYFFTHLVFKKYIYNNKERKKEKRKRGKKLTGISK